MRDFFRGWRRKAGCAALGIACVFMGAVLKQRVERRSTLAHYQEDYPVHRVDKDGNTVFKYSEHGEFVYQRLSWMPDLCVAIPLTLLSAYLILWPRRSVNSTAEKI
jgi:hypothetical protein